MRHMYLYVKYQTPTPHGSKDIHVAQVKLFFSLRCDADIDPDTDAMTIALRTVVPAS
jgi:hypothetical protein